MREIDWALMDSLEDDHAGWRAITTMSAPLGEVYVPGEGGGDIKALIIGEAPGAQEELKGRPFVGPAGVVLRQLMASAGLYAAPSARNRTFPNCWLTNVVKYHPPRNRKPTPIEIKLMRNGLRTEWAACGKPQLVIAVGGVALEAILGSRQSILRVAGKCQLRTSREGIPMALWPMVHPSFGLRNPPVQPLLERDWERLAAWRADIQHWKGWTDA